jgi:TPR repeat protein
LVSNQKFGNSLDMRNLLSVLLLCLLLASCGEEKTVEGEKTVQERAKAGNAMAQYNLGLMYDKGEGVPQDKAEAVKWYRKAAEQGDADAQVNLGFMYGNGDGVPQDDTEALKWHRKSAEQGHGFAQNNLTTMYRLGDGVPEDYTKAYMFYNLAAVNTKAKMLNNLADAITDKELSKTNMKDMKKIMTKEQIAESQKLTREWLERKAKEKGE